MSFDAAEFRRVLGHLGSGVAVVAAADPETGAVRGLTATAVTAVSLEPPLVLACIETGADTHDCIDRAAAFAVSILAGDSEALARRFAGTETERKFDSVPHRRALTGAPVLDAALAWLDCRLWARYPGGDHTIFVGEVVAGDAVGGAPLLHFQGRYGGFAP